MRICESSSAALFHEVALFFLSDIYTHISHLSSNAPKYKQETSVKKAVLLELQKRKYLNSTSISQGISSSYHVTYTF